MADQKTTGELRKAAEITDEQIDAAVDAVLAKPDTGAFELGAYSLDLAAAIEAHKPSAAALADPDRPEKFKRTMARTAILLARPDKA